MIRDIRKYIDFSNGVEVFPRRSIKSLLNRPLVIRSWQFMSGDWPVRKPLDKYLDMIVRVPEGDYNVKTGSKGIMGDIELIEKRQKELGEEGDELACMIRKFGKILRLCPPDWNRSDSHVCEEV